MNHTILSGCSFGNVFVCGKCNNIHINCGNFSTSFTADAFQELEKMIVQAKKSLDIQSLFHNQNQHKNAALHN